MEPIHHRMPVILASNAYEEWLDPSIHAVERLRALLRPFPSEAMEAFPISRFVNNPVNDRLECLMPFP